MIGLFAAVTIAVLGIGAAGPLMSNIEQPEYSVQRSDGPIELRVYSPMLVAETVVEDSRAAAVNRGFRILADYIFGANADKKKIEMTAPVMQREAPAATTDLADLEGKWVVRFVMPRKRSEERLPEPQDSRVKVEKLPRSTFAVIRFSGFWRDALLKQKLDELQAYVDRNKLTPHGAPIYAFYNPPWTLPFFRRNEIMIEVGRL